MPSIVQLDVKVTFDGNDLSDHILSATLSRSAELVEDTAMTTAGFRSRIAGLQDWSLEVTFKQDFDSSEVDETLYSRIGGSVISVVMTPTSAAAAPGNPSFTGNCILESYQPLAGGVGELSVVTATFQGVGALTRATS